MQYFSDGLTDELISALSHVRGLAVAGRSTSFSLKGKGLSATDAARQLQVAYLVDAAVRSGGSRVRVNWQIIDGRTGRGLRSGDIDGEMRDVISLQDSMAKTIVDSLAPLIGQVAQATIGKHQTANYEAHDLYLKGHFYWNQRTAETMRQGIEYLKQAIAKDPNYALAWAELASAYTIEPTFGDMRPAEVIQPAREAAKKAIDLDPTLAEANTAMGMSLTFNDWDPAAALPYLDRAIALDPRNSFPRLFRTWPLAMLGRGDEAYAEIRRAKALDPLSSIINTRVGTVLLFTHRFREAEAELRKVIAADPANLLARYELGDALAAQGRYDEAFAEFPDAIDVEAGNAYASIAWAAGLAGKPDRARAVLKRLQDHAKERYVPPLVLGVAAAGAGDMPLAMDYTEAGLRDHSFNLPFAGFEILYDPMRKEPRFQNVLRQVEAKHSTQVGRYTRTSGH
jgi:TolB-like protein/tetratricopeptide (TPR) repeat protein